MRILHVYRTYFPDPQGGLQEAIRQIVLATHAHGVEARVFTLSPDPQPACVERSEGLVVRSRSLAAPASCDLGGPDAFVEFGRQARWADVVHYHFPWPFADLLHLSTGLRRPAVMTYHSDIVRQRMLARLYRPLAARMLRSMDAVVMTSPAYARGSAWLTTIVDADRRRVIPLGIVEDSYADAVHEAASIDTAERFAEPMRLARCRDGFFLAIGVLRYYKGFDVLIDAAARNGLSVLIAGHGPMRESLEAYVRERNAPVAFLGHVTEAEKMALLRDCRALVLPSPLRAEAFGMVLVEASMARRPMITCEIGTGTSYVNLADETGFVVAPHDAVALSDAMLALDADPALRERFGAAARRRYERFFAGDLLGRNYVGLYDELCREFGGEMMAARPGAR
ncbi:MAG TPA: glycosyltransferase [Zeimonas sp.]